LLIYLQYAGKSAGIVTGSGTGQGVVARNWDNGGYIGGGFGNTPCYRGEVHSKFLGKRFYFQFIFFKT
jgi:hypothetical protein